jgi:hypothetical protein
MPGVPGGTGPRLSAKKDRGSEGPRPGRLTYASGGPGRGSPRIDEGSGLRHLTPTL